MSQNDYFNFNNLKSIVFLGNLSNIEELVKINKKLKINTTIISGTDQSKQINPRLNHYIFNKLDNKLKNFIKKKFDPDTTLFISLGARYIFKKEHINDFFFNKLINYHAARLPFDAGGGGWSWRIMKNDRIDNQLFHIIDEKIDGGPIIDAQLSLIPKNIITPKEFEEFRKKKFKIFYSNFIKKLQKKFKFKLVNQLEYIGNYYPRLKTKYNGWIDWNLDAHDLLYFINAFDDPFEGASTFVNNKNFKKVFVKKAQVHGGEQLNHPYMTGLVLKKNKSWIIVATAGKYCLILEEVLDQKGKNVINKINVGDRFFSKKEVLDKAKSLRIFYNTKGLKK